MFAVIRTGGKQYRVAPNDRIRVELLPHEAGAEIELSEVLALSGPDSVTIGAPLVEGARVAATVVRHLQDDKVLIFKKRRRKNSRRLRGHRQRLTMLHIDEILTAGQTRSAKPAAAAAPAKKSAPAKKAAAKLAQPKKAAAPGKAKPAKAAKPVKKPAKK